MAIVHRFLAIVVAALTAWTALAANAAAAPVGVPAAPGGTVVGFGSNEFGQLDVPGLPSGVVYTAVAAGDRHSLVLRSDGEVVGFGDSADGKTTVPALPPGITYTAIAVGAFHSLALRSDGQVVGFGSDSFGQATAPVLPTGVAYTAISAGNFHSLALRSDGQVVAFGYDFVNPPPPVTTVPPLPPGVTYTAVAAGARHSLALRSDGRIVGFGSDFEGQATPPSPVVCVVAEICIDLSLFGGYTAIAAAHDHSLALRRDGQVVGFGTNDFGQTTIPSPPLGLTYTAVAAGGRAGVTGGDHSLLLRSDGQVIGFGFNNHGQSTVPALGFGEQYIAVAAGHEHSLAIKTCAGEWCSSNFRLPPELRFLCPLLPGFPQFPCGPGELSAHARQERARK